MEIIPSINVSTVKEFNDYVQKITGYVDRVHLDIADGIFVPNKTIDGWPQVMNLDAPFSMGVHLMVSKPENHIASWIDTYVDKFIFHIESTSKAGEVINMVKDVDAQVGIALNPSTPIDDLSKYIDEIDFVHFMTVEPGPNGADFIDDVIEKIKDFHFLYPDVPMEVDGGITPKTIPALVEAGVSQFVVGSYIFENKKLSVKEAIEELKGIVNGEQ